MKNKEKIFQSGFEFDVVTFALIILGALVTFGIYNYYISVIHDPVIISLYVDAEFDYDSHGAYIVTRTEVNGDVTRYPVNVAELRDEIQNTGRMGSNILIHFVIDEHDWSRGRVNIRRVASDDDIRKFN